MSETADASERALFQQGAPESKDKGSVIGNTADSAEEALMNRREDNEEGQNDPVVTPEEAMAIQQQTKKDWDEKRREGVKNELGEEALQELTSTTEQITSALFDRLLAIKDEGGDTEQFMAMVREFSNALYARVSSENLKPESATTALSGATALMAPEAMHNFQEPAHNMVKALTGRYGNPS